MLNRRIAAGLAAVGAVVALNALTACVPSEGNPTVATPVPTPAEPVQETHCQIVWANLSTNNVDAFVVDGSLADWQNGTIADESTGAGSSFTRVYLHDLALGDVQANHALEVRPTKYLAGDNPVAIVTTGLFTVGVDLTGPANGGVLTYDDGSNDPAIGMDTSGAFTVTVGDMGAGTFSGVAQVEPPDTTASGDTVEVNLTSAGTLSLGNDGTWAMCYSQTQ